VAKRSLAPPRADHLAFTLAGHGPATMVAGPAAKLNTWLADGDYQVVQVEGIELARYVLQEAGSKKLPHHTPAEHAIRLDDHNCEYLLQQRTFETDVRHPSAGWVRRTRSCNGASCAPLRRLSAAPPTASWPCPTQTRCVKRLAPKLDVTVVRTGLIGQVCHPTLNPLPVSQERGADLVFTGTMDFRPNVDARCGSRKRSYP